VVDSGASPLERKATTHALVEKPAEKKEVNENARDELSGSFSSEHRRKCRDKDGVDVS
jgi:hypothetical protein